MKVVTTVVNPGGYLQDSNKDLHEITESGVKHLFRAEIPPAYVNSENGKGALPVWIVDQGGEEYYDYVPNVNPNKTLYDAVKDYVSHFVNGPCMLVQDDYNFYKDHPLSKFGLTENFILPLVHSLVYPWGMGIDNIWVNEGCESKSTKMFAKACGKEIVPGELPKFGFILFYSLTKIEIVGPRTAIKDDWKFGFTIGYEPKYVGDTTDIDAVLEESYYDEYVATQKKGKRTLSTWKSKIGGVTIADLSSKTHAVDKKSTALTVVKKTEKKCPTCGKDARRTDTTQPSVFHYCLSCDWYERVGERQCPLCGEKYSGFRCGNCQYDEIDWNQSRVFSCKIHPGTVIYFTRKELVPDNGDNVDKLGTTYLCPQCLKEYDGKVFDFIASGKTHNETTIGITNREQIPI